MNPIIGGGLAGFLATAPMTLVILGGRALGLLRTPAPAQITASVHRSATRSRNTPERSPTPAFTASWLSSHFGYGAMCGSIFARLRPSLPRNPALAGLMYGMTVWGVSYINLMPGLRLYPRVREDRPSRIAVMIAAHAVYGIALSAVHQSLSRRNTRSG